ncbi:netrin-4-like [Stigmatopora nigra]
MPLWTHLILFTLFGSSLLNDLNADDRCMRRACKPRMGNLAKGRVVTSQTECGANSSDPFCIFNHALAVPRRRRPRKFCSTPPACGKCNASITGQAHPASAMSDSSFTTWWQSAAGVDEEMLSLDLETEFVFTEIVLVFRSPRPAAMVLERSQDRGRTWNTLKYYARECVEAFGFSEESLAGTTCTSKYSGAFPCTGGEVIYRAVQNWNSVDPLGPAAKEELVFTNLRVRLLRRQQCPCQAQQPGAALLPTDHYAISHLVIKGSCLCNGHADQCMPVKGLRLSQQQTVDMVHGKCVCRHNTAGDHCERCAPLYNQQPWRAATGIKGTPHQCQKCKCNGHAKSCHFHRRLWLASGRRNGGVCDDCRHNTVGRHCQNCKKGFFRDPSRPKTAKDSCKPCSCHGVGSVFTGGLSLCDPANGQCPCKPGVGGSHCDRCAVGHWGLHQYGCKPCDCPAQCDHYTGDCIGGSQVQATGQLKDSQEDSAHFRPEELFSALHHSEKCKCVEMTLSNPKLFCAAEYDYVLVGKVMSARDKGSHAEVEIKVKKLLYQKPHVKIQRGMITLHPELWTTRGCTCPILNPGSEYLVAGHKVWRNGRLVVNGKSHVSPWVSSLSRKIIHMVQRDCIQW